MEIAQAQLDVRQAYLRGGPGAVVSGLVWLIAGLVAETYGVAQGFVVLFFGGMSIFPISAAILRVVWRRQIQIPRNPSGLTVIETVFPMIGGLLGAWLLVPHRPEFVFPLAAIAVGTHYFGFRTAYGDWTNWLLGGLLSLIGLGTIFYAVPAGNQVPFLVAATEIVFGIGLTWISLAKDPVGNGC